jgi:hypothetical protein
MFFSKKSRSAAEVAWWRDAEAAAAAPAPEIVDRLRAGLAAAAAPDDRERREEFVDGLERVLELSANGGLPALVTQHRVIGTDVCHFVSPASLAAQLESSGKLFLTSERIVFASHGVQSWPWHRVRGAVRLGRDLAVTIAGVAEPVHIQCNCYGDAMAALHIVATLSSRKA